MTLRLTSSSLAGTSRKLVAVGTARLPAMFATIACAGAADGLADLAVAGWRLGDRRDRARAGAGAGGAPPRGRPTAMP